MGKVSCAICNKRCRGTVLKIEDHYIHKLCFKCHKCGKALDEKDFQFRDQCLYCPEDYRQEYSIKCAACGNPVEGEVVTALGSTFHTFCLRCFSCNRTISSGEKTMSFNNRFYCEKCVPPQIALEDSTGVEEAISNPPEKWISSSSPAPAPELSVEPQEKSLPKVKIPKSSSLPRRLGGLFRSKKSHSQTLQPIAPSIQMDDLDSKNVTLTNGPDALTVNVAEVDMTSTDSGIGKKFDHSQSPTYSLYSGDETVLVKQQDVQTTPIENYSVIHSTSGTPAVPYSLDAALTTPSMVNTLSGDVSTLLFGSVKRICPPGVDYGHQYPVSYLRLAEQGYTAVTSSDLLSSTSPLSATTTPASIRRPPPSASVSSTQRLSRRDMPSTHHAQTRTLPTSSADPTSRQIGGYMDHRYNAQVFGEVDGARPEKDRYTRYRQLSPAGNSMGRALSSGRSGGAPPNFIVRKSHTYSSYSTPNVNSRRAESMMRSPPRTGRSMSPEAALLVQAEARRLAAYPGAKIPDADSEPAIDRYDWPAPPSPAVVMIDRRREKAMKSGTLPGARTVAKSEESSSDTPTLSPGTAHSLSPEKDAPLTSVESKIDTLKRTTGNSGMSAAVAQYVEEEEKRRKNSSPDLDPISASRSPSANFEPPYSTRYANHRFACRREKTFDSLRSVAPPSRSTLRREEMRDGLTATRDHFSTSPIIPRPGYTSGILSSRPVSLPRGVNGVASTATLPPWSSTLSPAQRKIFASNTSRTLPANTPSGPLSDSRNGGFSLSTSQMRQPQQPYEFGLQHSTVQSNSTSTAATSGLSMNGVVGTTEVQLTQPSITSKTVQGTHRARSTTLTGGLPPPSISGLRPVAPRNYNYLGGTSFELSRGRPTTAAAISTTNGWRAARTASENARSTARGGSTALLDDEYPDVQSWLRPTKSQQCQEQKVYSYDQLKLSSEANLKGIDGRHREEYLSREEFERLFKMPKTAFQRLPEWKKSDLKRRLDLY